MTHGTQKETSRFLCFFFAGLNIRNASQYNAPQVKSSTNCSLQNYLITLAQHLTSLMILWLNENESLQRTGSEIWWKAFPGEWRLLQQNIITTMLCNEMFNNHLFTIINYICLI